MKPEHRKQILDNIAETFGDAERRLNEMLPKITLLCDRKAIDDILTELGWAMENCTVVGLHQVDQAMDDDMGTGLGTELEEDDV